MCKKQQILWYLRWQEWLLVIVVLTFMVLSLIMSPDKPGDRPSYSLPGKPGQTKY